MRSLELCSALLAALATPALCQDCTCEHDTDTARGVHVNEVVEALQQSLHGCEPFAAEVVLNAARIELRATIAPEARFVWDEPDCTLSIDAFRRGFADLVATCPKDSTDPAVLFATVAEALSPCVASAVYGTAPGCLFAGGRFASSAEMQTAIFVTEEDSTVIASVSVPTFSDRPLLCSHDSDESDAVEVYEIVRAVNEALHGCVPPDGPGPDRAVVRSLGIRADRTLVSVPVPTPSSITLCFPITWEPPVLITPTP